MPVGGRRKYKAARNEGWRGGPSTDKEESDKAFPKHKL